MKIVVTGSPVEGFGFHGPFDDQDAAVEWAETELRENWWTADLDDPSPPVELPADVKARVAIEQFEWDED